MRDTVEIARDLVRAHVRKAYKQRMLPEDDDLAVAIAAAIEKDRAETIEPRPLDEWHEDIGNVLWWIFPVREPPYAGTPLDDSWPGYHTHWTRIALPTPPRAEP